MTEDICTSDLENETNEMSAPVIMSDFSSSHVIGMVKTSQLPYLEEKQKEKNRSIPTPTMLRQEALSGIVWSAGKSPPQERKEIKSSCITIGYDQEVQSWTR